MMALLRYGLPAVLAVAGFVVLFVADDANAVEGWAMLEGAAIALIVWNILFRIGFSGDREREREEEARRYLTEHGHWPDETPPRRGGSPSPSAGRARPSRRTSRAATSCSRPAAAASPWGRTRR